MAEFLGGGWKQQINPSEILSLQIESGGGLPSLMVIQATSTLTQRLQLDVITQVTSSSAVITQCPCLLQTVVIDGAQSTSQSDRCQREDTCQLERAVAVSFINSK